MAAIERGLRTAEFDADALKRMVGPDPHRPGTARGRLLAEQIPVWALIGHLGAIVGPTDPTAITDEAIAQVAADYAITLQAALAALLYYQEHGAAIDALLEANAEALA